MGISAFGTLYIADASNSRVLRMNSLEKADTGCPSCQGVKKSRPTLECRQCLNCGDCHASCKCYEGPGIAFEPKD